jgi:RecA-family ATPase
MISKDIKIHVSTGDDLFKRDTEVLPIIDGYLWERDVVMLFGNEKAGKSILALQMACSISSGDLFMGKFKTIQKPVIYLQTEGKKDETPKRLEDMNRAIKLDKVKFFKLYKKFMPLDIPEYAEALDLELSAIPIKGGVIIIDCLYMTMLGDLNDNEAVRVFIGLLSEILEKYLLTCVLIHHAKREQIGENGNIVQLGDKSSYGSVFLRANVDHILYLEMLKDKSRVLSCDTQRSGKVSERESLVLMQPSPLFFKVKGELPASEESILWHLNSKNMAKSEIITMTGLSETTVEKGIKELIYNGKINIINEEISHSGSPKKIFGVIKRC